MSLPDEDEEVQAFYWLGLAYVRSGLAEGVEGPALMEGRTASIRSLGENDEEQEQNVVHIAPAASEGSQREAGGGSRGEDQGVERGSSRLLWRKFEQNLRCPPWLGYCWSKYGSCC